MGLPIWMFVSIEAILALSLITVVIGLPSRRRSLARVKRDPNPQLSDEQRPPIQALSQIRIFIEHAVRSMKRYHILVHAFRNRLEEF